MTGNVSRAEGGVITSKPQRIGRIRSYIHLVLSLREDGFIS